MTESKVIGLYLRAETIKFSITIPYNFLSFSAIRSTADGQNYKEFQEFGNAHMKYLSFAAKEFFQHSEKNDEEICNRLEITGKGHIDIDIHSPPPAPLSLRIHFPYLRK